MGDDGHDGAAAIGLYLTFFAGIAWVVGAVLELKGAKAGTPAAASDG